MKVYHAVAGGDDMAVLLDRYNISPTAATATQSVSAAGIEPQGAPHALLTLAIPQTTARKAIHRAILLLNLHGMELQRAQVDTIDDLSGSDVVLLRTVVRTLDGGSFDGARGEALVADAARLKWSSDQAYGLAGSSNGELNLLEAEVALGLADLSLSRLDHPLLSRKHVRERLLLEDVRPIAANLAKTFLSRFDPNASTRMDEQSYAAVLSQTLKDIETGPGNRDEQSKQMLRAMTSAAKHTLRTNVHVDGRWALSMRLDPRFFEPILPPIAAGFSNLPYGTFFVAGRHFNGYHNRFRDIARGGLRVVLPPSESTRRKAEDTLWNALVYHGRSN